MSSSVNWKGTQECLNANNFAAGVVDGIPGPATYAALLWATAGRRPDAAMRSIARSMSVYLPRYGVDGGRERLANFLANTCHETGGYRRFEENMRYSARRIMEVWPTRFKTLQSALPFAWDPRDPDREDVKLANSVYGGRMGNARNGTEDNDGWDYRGSGLLQHTGAAEYQVLRTRVGLTADEVRDPAKAVLAACDFWERGKLNEVSDSGDAVRVRRILNGGAIGLADVLRKRKQIMEFLR